MTNPLFDDMAKMASGAASTLFDMKQEVETMVKAQCERMFPRDMVKRDEFDAVKAMAEKAREENEALKARLDTLEKSAKKAPAKKAPAKKPAAKKK